jgi:cell division protein FtsB
VKADDWSVEMQQLQAKRDGIEEQINSLRDQARHHGVAPNTLP